MGPGDMSSSTSTIKLLNLPRLKDDGTNYILYKERIPNVATSKGLRRVLYGTAKKPVEMTEINGDYYLLGNLAPLSDDEVEKQLTLQDAYDQKEAQVREMMYETISTSTFMQIKNEPTAAAMWKKLTSIFEEKGISTQENLFNKLQNQHCPDDGDIRIHLANMSRMREELAAMGKSISDDSYATYIRTSLPTSYRPTLDTLDIASQMIGKPVSSSLLIQRIQETADRRQVEKDIDESIQNSALFSSNSKGKGKGKGKATGKKEEKGSNNGLHCNNCSRNNHVERDCYREGGGKAGQAPWDKAKKTTQANAAEKADDETPVNHGFAAILEVDTPVLKCTSDFQAQAQALAASGNDTICEIVDTGASNHFTGYRERFNNFTPIKPIPIKAADGRTFSAIGKGDYPTQLPMGPDQKPTPVTLYNTYYSPSMAFTLISVSCLDQSGYALTIQDGNCTIQSPQPKRKTIGVIPMTRGLYRITTPRAPPPMPNIPIAASAERLVTMREFHNLMGHPSEAVLITMAKSGSTLGIRVDLGTKVGFCQACVQAKAARKPFPKISLGNETAKAYGDKVVTDVWGPADTESISGHKYSNTYQDVSSREEKVYFMKKKSESYSRYLKYEPWAKVQRGAKNVRILGSD